MSFDGATTKVLNPIIDPCAADCIDCGFCDEMNREEEADRNEADEEAATLENFGFLSCAVGNRDHRNNDFNDRHKKDDTTSWSRQTRDRYQWQRRFQREQNFQHWALTSWDPRAIAWREAYLKRQAERELDQQSWENFLSNVPTNKCSNEYKMWVRKQKRIQRTVQAERNRQSDLLWDDYQREREDTLPVMSGMSPEEAQAYEDEWENDTFASRSFLYGQDMESWDHETRVRARRGYHPGSSYDSSVFDPFDSLDEWDYWDFDMYDDPYGAPDPCWDEECDPYDEGLCYDDEYDDEYDFDYEEDRRRMREHCQDELLDSLFVGRKDDGMRFVRTVAGGRYKQIRVHVPTEDLTPEDYGIDTCVRTGMRSETGNRHPHRSKAAYMLQRRRARKGRAFRAQEQRLLDLLQAREDELQDEYDRTVTRETWAA